MKKLPVYLPVVFSVGALVMGSLACNVIVSALSPAATVPPGPIAAPGDATAAPLISQQITLVSQPRDETSQIRHLGSMSRYLSLPAATIRE